MDADEIARLLTAQGSAATEREARIQRMARVIHERDAAQDEARRLRAALIRWHNANGTAHFQDADDALAELARDLAEARLDDLMTTE